MAKRFTDTGKYRKAWFRALPPRLKCAWDFLCLECDHAGIWNIDIESLAFHVGEPVSLADILSNFEVIQVREDKILIPGFIEFQYGCTVENLNPENKVHLSVITALKKLGAYKDHTSPMQGAKDKDKEKERDKERGSAEGENIPPAEVTPADLEAAYKNFPLQKGKTAGLKKLKAEIKTKQDLADLNRAIAIYAKEVAGRPPDKIKHFSTFVNMPWRDCLDPDYGKSSARAPDDPAKDPANWEQTAALVLEAVIAAGSGTQAYAEREARLGPELHAIAVKAGIQKIRDVQRGAFQLRNIAEMLQNAAELLNGGQNANVLALR